MGSYKFLNRKISSVAGIILILAYAALMIAFLIWHFSSLEDVNISSGKIPLNSTSSLEQDITNPD